MKRIYRLISDLCAVCMDEIRMMLKDEGVLIFVILVPLLYPLLYSWIYNNEVVREVPVAVVDMSHSFKSREFLRMMDSSPDVDVAYYCNNMDEARKLMGHQKVYGIIYFPQDFQNKLDRSEQVHVGVYCNMSLMLTYKAIYQTSVAVSSKINSEIQIAASQATAVTERDEEITTKPLEFDEVQIFNPTGGYGNAILPGVLMVIIQQTLLLGIGLAAGTQREKNRYGNLIPTDRHYNGVMRIVWGKALAYIMLYAIISAYLVLVVTKIFGFTHIGHVPDLIGLLLPYNLACIFFGMTISCMIRYRENVMLLVVFMSLILLFMSGISWPYANIPSYWKAVAVIFPSTFGVRGFLKISSMGGTLSDISYEYTALLIQMTVYFLLACAVYQVHLRRARKNNP